jgi:hypothetical protein
MGAPRLLEKRLSLNVIDMGGMDKVLRQFALEMGVGRQEIVNGFMDEISVSELCNIVSNIELVVEGRYFQKIAARISSQSSENVWMAFIKIQEYSLGTVISLRGRS